MGIVEAERLGAVVGGPTGGTNGNTNPFSVAGGYGLRWTGMDVRKKDGSPRKAPHPDGALQARGVVCRGPASRGRSGRPGEPTKGVHPAEEVGQSVSGVRTRPRWGYQVGLSADFGIELIEHTPTSRGSKPTVAAMPQGNSDF